VPRGAGWNFEGDAERRGAGHVRGNRTGLGELPVIAIGGPKLSPGAAADQAPRQDPDKLADQREEGRIANPAEAGSDLMP
jgi:hypothetical protein